MTEVSTHERRVVPLHADAETRAALEAENARLRSALESQVVIEQAKGAISARLGTTPDVAFELMRGLARSQRRDLHAFAAETLANRGRLS